MKFLFPSQGTKLNQNKNNHLITNKEQQPSQRSQHQGGYPQLDKKPTCP